MDLIQIIKVIAGILFLWYFMYVLMKKLRGIP